MNPTQHPACHRMLLTAAALLTTAITVHAWTSSKVTVNAATGALGYPADAEGNRIVDFSNAGYGGANQELPNVTRTVGTIPAGSTLAQINAAIAAANVSPTQRGVLLMEAGTYTINGTIVLNKPGLTLRGAGDGRSGGAATIIKQTNMTFGVVVIDINGGTADKFGTKVAGTETEITTQRVQVGARSFQVADASGYRVGDNIIIDHPCTPAWENQVDPENLWDEIDIKLGSIRYHRYITAILGNTITVDAPVFNHLDRSLSVSTVYKYGGTGYIREVGLENLQVQGAIRTDNTNKNGTDDAIRFQAVEDCWIRGVSVKNAARAGVIFSNSTRCTAYDSRVTNPSGIETGGNWYGFTVEQGQLILFEKCYTQNQRHSFIANGTCYDSGIVVLDCTMDKIQATAEMHRYWGQAMLFDTCAVTNPEAASSLGFFNRGTAGTNHGWAAAHSVMWNCKGGGTNFILQKPVTAQNYSIGNANCTLTNNGIGAGSLGYVEGTNNAGLNPTSLYLAQLNLRLSQPVVYEAETADPVASGTGASINILADPDANGDSHVVLRADGAGDSVEYTLHNVPAGTYELRLRYRAASNRGILSLRVDGTQRGSNLDQYAATASFKEQSFGQVTFFNTGSHKIRLSVASKAASASAFDLGADAFIFVRVP